MGKTFFSDAIIFNGVFGWNDIPEHRPFPPHELPSLQLFRPTVFPPLSTHAYHTGAENKHIYEFYSK